MGLIAFFETRLGAYMVVVLMLALVAGGIMLHMRLSADKIAELRQEVDKLTAQTATLQAANAAIREDVVNVAQAQISANAQLDNIRHQAALNVQALRLKPPSTQDAVNQQWRTLFSGLEATSHGP